MSGRSSSFGFHALEEQYDGFSVAHTPPSLWQPDHEKHLLCFCQALSHS